MKFSSRILRRVVGLILVILANPLIADEAAEKAAREKLEQELEAAEERFADERIDVTAIDVIRQFGHEIRFDEPLVNISLGHSNDAAGDRHNYTFVKFGLALLDGGLFFDDLRYFTLSERWSFFSSLLISLWWIIDFGLPLVPWRLALARIRDIFSPCWRKSYVAVNFSHAKLNLFFCRIGVSITFPHPTCVFAEVVEVR
jgi:hypothetical protein